MHRVHAGRWLNRAFRIGEASTRGVPIFLCPAVGLRRTVQPAARPRWSSVRQRLNHTHAAHAVIDAEQDAEPARKLPVTCSGCGAFAQTTDASQLGYYDLRSKRVRLWLRPRQKGAWHSDPAEDQIVADALRGLSHEKLQLLGLEKDALLDIGDEPPVTASSLERAPVCDRCHDLVHYSTAGQTAKLVMHHPTVESLRETIEESPYKYNHIYHIIDAADFPMSLIPRLSVLLGDISLRSRNRRSRSGKFQHDRKTEMSFIITRSDLLGPTKEMVDSMMPYLREVLRDALGRLGGRIRLGNLKCVSARRGWWTKDVKEDIWQKGGAGWMVGKVNVGKSQLFEAVFPKGRMADGKNAMTASPVSKAWQDLDVGNLLPPAQPATNFPEMPVVSSLPGTTASPIRVPFGNGKGELIDLPGLARSDLETFVREDLRQTLIMKKRIIPEQVTLKTGKSIILGGGLIRITPRTPDMIFLVYNFTPLKEHVTATEKAIAFQSQVRESDGIENITVAGARDKMKHAGTIKLCHDVTKRRAGPLTRKNAVGLQVDRLPFRVVSVDILIEGVGYVEVVAQVRARDFDRWSRMQEQKNMTGNHADELAPTSSPNDPFESILRNRKDGMSEAQPVEEALPEVDWPAIDVFSPEGKFVGSRKPIHGWLNNRPRVLAEHKKSRPRRSMKGVKKRAKAERRAQ